MSQLLQFCFGYWLYIHHLFANLEALYLKKLQGLIEQQSYAQAQEVAREWIIDDPLSPDAFGWLAEIQSALGESQQHAPLQKRAGQLRQIAMNTKRSLSLERYTSLQAQHGPQACLQLEGFDFVVLRPVAGDLFGLLSSVSTCGTVELRVFVEGAASNFYQEQRILQSIAGRPSQTAPKLMASGVLNSVAIERIQKIMPKQSGSLHADLKWNYSLLRYDRADQGRFGLADLVLALLEQQALGIYQNNVTLANVRYDSVQRILRLTDYSHAGFLAPDIQNLAPKAYVEWCQQQEINRVRAGGEASFLLASLHDYSWIWESHRLNLKATQAFHLPRIGQLEEPSVQSINCDQVVLAGSRDWESSAEAIKKFGLDADVSILDVGCGYGAAAHHLKGHFSRYTGVDVEVSLLTHAQLLANLQQMEADFIEHDFDYEPMEQQWDCVLLCGVMHHFAKPDHALERIQACCRKQLFIECSLQAVGRKWLGCWYQRLDPQWFFEDLAALQLSLEQNLPAFVLRGAPVPIDVGRYLFAFERTGGNA
ncbi:MAG: class I SAM-dependent methyltransferase [Opitutales bacterium]